MKRKEQPTDARSALDEDIIDDIQGDKCLIKKYKNIARSIQDEEPTIQKILQTDLLQDDQNELIQLYQVYSNLEYDPTIERLEIRRELIDKLKKGKLKYAQYHKFTEQQHTDFQTKIAQLQTYNASEELKYEIMQLNTSEANRRIIFSEYQRMLQLSYNNDELPKLRYWLNWAISLPHDNITSTRYSPKQINELLQKVWSALQEELYGMDQVKEQILVFLNSRLLNPSATKCSLGLISPPGCGKTTIVRLLSKILNIPLEQISLGGIQSADFLKGHSYTYVGSEPGEIVKCLTKMKVKNGILFLDEFDKISENKEVCSALLHITDSSQNNKFQDNFLNQISIDLSHLWFIYSMNQKPSDDALADRIFYIQVKGYTQQDKFLIVKNFLLKKLHKHLNWLEGSLSFEDDAIRELVERVSPPSIPGIRTLDDAVHNIGNKISFLYHHPRSFTTSFQLDCRVTLPFVINRSRLECLLKIT